MRVAIRAAWVARQEVEKARRTLRDAEETLKQSKRVTARIHLLAD
jgi:hypothetical protein